MSAGTGKSMRADIEQVASSITESSSIVDDVWNLYKQVETQSENIKSQWQTTGGEKVCTKIDRFETETLKPFMQEIDGYVKQLGLVSDLLNKINEVGL